MVCTHADCACSYILASHLQFISRDNNNIIHDDDHAYQLELTPDVIVLVPVWPGMAWQIMVARIDGL